MQVVQFATALHDVVMHLTTSKKHRCKKNVPEKNKKNVKKRKKRDKNKKKRL